MNSITGLIFGQFLPLLIINTLFLTILLRLIFFRYSPKRNALFGYFMFGCGVFSVTNLLQGVEISMGFAFGLFAIFAMLRYRTEAISIRDMTYLFLVIVISLINGVGPLSIASLITVNAILCAIVAFGETSLFAPRIFIKNIRYENIENIRPENYELLMADIKERTGLQIERVQISNIDFLSDVANIKVFHYELPPRNLTKLDSKNTTPLKGENSA